MTGQLNGKKYCGKFNSKHGCTHKERDCPNYALHACAYRTGPTTVCGSYKHGYHTHQQR